MVLQQCDAITLCNQKMYIKLIKNVVSPFLKQSKIIIVFYILDIANILLDKLDFLFGF